MAVNKDFVVKNGLQVGANTSIEGSITTVDSVQFDTSAAVTVGEGQLAWNAEEGTLDLGLVNGGVTLQVGQEQHVYARNVGTVDITNGTVVRVTGASGNKITVEAASYDQESISSTTIGVATEDINQNSSGYVTLQGTVRNIDTSAIAEGAAIYLGSNGTFTATKPNTPNHLVVVGYVVRSHATEGSILLHVQNGWELEELHNVLITNVANNQILTYDATNSYWKNSSDLNIPGNLSVDGNLIISGNTTSVNTNNLTIEDLNITLASGANTAAEADGAGITVAGANAQIIYDATNDLWALTKDVSFYGNIQGNTYQYGNNTIEGTFSNYGYLLTSGEINIANDTDYAVLSFQGSAATIQYDYNTDTLEFLNSGTNGSFDFWAPAVFKYDITANNISSNTVTTSTANTTTLNATTGNITTVNATTVNATDFYGDLNGSVANTTLNYSTTSLADGAGTQGNFYFDALNQKLKVHTGSVWVDAVPAGSGSSSNTVSTDANTTFRKYTYDVTTSTNSVSGADANGETLTYVTDGSQNVEVYVNGVKAVEGATNDYVATTGTAVTFTSNLLIGDVVDIQVYELLTNDAFYLKDEVYTKIETNSQITTALGGYVPKTGGTFTGNLGVGMVSPVQSFAVRSNTTTIGATQHYLASFNRQNSDTAALYIGNDGNLNAVIAANNGKLRIGKDFAGTFSEYAVIDGSGNVGIGTSLPSHKLAVFGRTEIQDTAQSYGLVDNARYPLIFASDSFGEFGFNGHLILQPRTSAGGAIILATGIGASTERVRVDALGDVTINTGILNLNNSIDLVGTASSIPSSGGIARLSNGYTYFTGKNNDNGTVFSNGDGTATIRAMNPGSSAGYLQFETGAGSLVLSIDTSGNLYPEGTTQDLGTSAKPWQNIYTQDLVLSNESRPTGNEVDGTKGNWTIQEGEDHLYIINNKNGKKYRFALEEIE